MVAPSQRAQRCSSSAKPVPQRVAAHGELDQRFLNEDGQVAMAAAAPGSKQRHAATAASPFCPHRRSLHGQGHLPRQPIPRPGMSQDVEGDKSRSIDG